MRNRSFLLIAGAALIGLFLVIGSMVATMTWSTPQGYQQGPYGPYGMMGRMGRYQVAVVTVT